MKPVSVRFKCFGPYVQEQFIDFSELKKSGLFLITGETGAGKTTILDAMCYALYGESSGGKRGGLESMRCKLADKKDDTEVEFVFDNNGQRYKFTRSLKTINKRKAREPKAQPEKKTKTAEYNDSHCCYVLRDDVWVVLEEKMSMVNKRAESIVGLTKDQFRQVIILPQGQFERFLVAGSEEKESILATLFNVGQWSRITAEIGKRIDARGDKLKLEKAAIEEGLLRYGCADLESLEAKGAQWEQEQQTLIPRVTEACQAEEKARETLRLQQQVAKDHETYGEKLRAYDNLKNSEESIQKLEDSLALADRAEQIRDPYDTLCNARRKFREAEASVIKGKDRVRMAKDKRDSAQRDLESHIALEKDMEAKKNERLLLENAGQVYEKMDDLRKKEGEARKEFDRCDRNFRDREKMLEKWERELTVAFQAQTRARDTYHDAQLRYRRGIGGILAADLEEGKRCPVCGSLEHPDPAPMSDDPVTDAQLDALNRLMGDADKAAVKARNERINAEENRNRAQQLRSAAEQALALAQAEFDSARKQKITGIETAAELSRALRKLDEELQNWNETGKRLQDVCNKANGDYRAAEQILKTAQSDWETAGKDYREQQTLWEAACASVGFTTEDDFRAAWLEPREKQNRRRRVAAFRTELQVAASALETAKAAVGDKPVPDIPALKKTLSEAQQRNQELERDRIVLETNLNALRIDQKKLADRLGAYEQAVALWREDQLFARRLAGSNGVGLQRYVLGVMMNSVTTQANRLLENVYGGRYRLYRTNDATGGKHKAGLELEVYDSQNNQRRSVKTLSGGEKFLVALSLAIGLSTVVQAQGEGIRLEAMFIDEGFGSLDREAIQDALDILDGIRRTAGVVGIISHVEALAESIPVQLRITKGKQGSKVSILGV